MELQEACKIIEKVCNDHVGTKKDHIIIEKALIKIKEILPLEKPEEINEF